MAGNWLSGKIGTKTHFLPDAAGKIGFKTNFPQNLVINSGKIGTKTNFPQNLVTINSVKIGT